MTDRITPDRRSANMARIRAKDTKPELLVRRMAHRLGYRFRLHRKDLPGCPDLVFPSRRVALFVNGCFWHGHDCKEGRRVPKSNTDYWLEKVARNRMRDAVNMESLCSQGWAVSVIWECETSCYEVLQGKLLDLLG